MRQAQVRATTVERSELRATNGEQQRIHGDAVSHQSLKSTAQEVRIRAITT